MHDDIVIIDNAEAKDADNEARQATSRRRSSLLQDTRSKLLTTKTADAESVDEMDDEE